MARDPMLRGTRNPPITVDGSMKRNVVEHRVGDIVLDPFGARCVVCSCGFRTGYWSTPQLAMHEWKTHHAPKDAFRR